jgi:hypothetical protein
MLRKLMSSRQFLINTKLVVSKQFSLLKEKVESLESNGIYEVRVMSTKL